VGREDGGESLAEGILDGMGKGKEGLKGWYNATEIGYSEGLERGDERLLREKIGVAKPGEEVRVKVPRHGVKMFKLRPWSEDWGGRRYVTHRDEL
jgi:hypothetical protein